MCNGAEMVYGTSILSNRQDTAVLLTVAFVLIAEADCEGAPVYVWRGSWGWGEFGVLSQGRKKEIRLLLCYPFHISERKNFCPNANILKLGPFGTPAISLRVVLVGRICTANPFGHAAVSVW